MFTFFKPNQGGAVNSPWLCRKFPGKKTNLSTSLWWTNSLKILPENLDIMLDRVLNISLIVVQNLTDWKMQFKKFGWNNLKTCTVYYHQYLFALSHPCLNDHCSYAYWASSIQENCCIPKCSLHLSVDFTQVTTPVCYATHDSTLELWTYFYLGLSQLGFIL